MWPAELHSMFCTSLPVVFWVVKCWIHRKNNDTELEEEQWQGCFHWTGRGFSDYYWCCFFGYGLVLRVSAGGHLHRDVGEESPPSGGVLLGLESDIGRGTGRATGGGGGSKKEPGILLWPLPFGCRQHKKVQEGDMRQSADRG